MRSVVLVAFLAGVGLTSCVAPTLYHDQTKLCSGDPQSECARAAVEDHEEYLLGFVEFDDLGWAWERGQGEVLLRTLLAEQRELLMVVFAHGWKHNASTCDTNVTCFRETLRRLYETEKKLAAANQRAERRIVGVYVGWRGLSSRGGLLKQTTFYGRKGTAHQVGSGAVTELLVRLAEVRQRKHEAAVKSGQESSTRLVIVGHSFGGALIYSATSQLMMERLVVADERGGQVRGLGDLVVLVNPAFEAARYQPLHATVNEKTTAEFTSDQDPVFAIFTSTGDTATGRLFPLGRFFSAKFDDYRTDGERRRQKLSNRAAVGHFEPFRTHFLETNDDTPAAEKVADARTAACGCPFLTTAGARAMALRDDWQILERLREERETSGGVRMTFPTASLVYEQGPSTQNLDKRSPFSPIQVISVDNEIITGHNDIYRPAFIDFLRFYIMLSTQ